jgi:hypothetical protein
MQGSMPVIPQEAIVEIKVNGSFYYRVTQLMMELVQDLEPQRIAEIFERISNENVQEPIEAHVETLAVLMNEIERCAKEQNVLEEVDPSTLEDSEEES